MNCKELYQEIGNIDDDLIQAANENHGQKNRKEISYFLAWIAACLCLICGGIIFGLKRDIVYINDISAPATSKINVSADENTNIVSMTYHELLDYYEMAKLPDSLGEVLTRMEQSYFVLYQDQAGNVLYDTNNIFYCNADRSKSLSITFTKIKEVSNDITEDIRWSRISGIPVLIAFSLSGEDYKVYWADFEFKDVSVKVTSEGLNEKEFVDTIKEFIAMSEIK